MLFWLVLGCNHHISSTGVVDTAIITQTMCESCLQLSTGSNGPSQKTLTDTAGATQRMY